MFNIRNNMWLKQSLILIFLYLVMIIYWKSYVSINNSFVPDTFEKEALKVDLVFNFIFLIFVMPLGLYLSIKGTKLIKLTALIVMTCIVIVFSLYANKVSSLVGGIL
ncbi:MAG: hypothetical protein B7Y56_15970 [Gallionellales bacterium 35-53-114]|jgi:fatty acid desaturase|nr:MAG: hypothetical protein B7Y56_15970 [Gallionellales bacterium 35-53-114]